MNALQIIEAIRARADCQPDAPALTRAGGRRRPYREIAAELDRLTAGLIAAGLRPGDAVVYSVRARPESILLILAVVRCGGVVVAAEPGMSPELFAARMALLEPRWVMAETAVYALSVLRPARALLERRGVALPNFDLPGARRLLVGPALPGTLTYAGLHGRGQPQPLPEVDPAAPAMVVFTSGTTSAPRGVVHTGASIGAGLAMVAEHLALEPGDRVYSDQMHMIVPALLAGAEAIVPGHAGSAGAAADDLDRHRPTHAFWVPAQLADILALPGAVALPGTIVLGSAPVPRAFLDRSRDRLAGSRVCAAYALTEMLPVAWVEMEEKLAFAGPGDLVGTPCPGVRVRIAADGEIILSGPSQCAGYLGEPALAEVASGDVGRLQDGRLILLGRKKDMIIRRAQNIYPGLVEDAVAAVPGVARCALVGVYDAGRADEAVVLAVEPEAGAGGPGLRRRVERAITAGPRRIDVAARPDRIVVTRIPLAGRSRKVDRARLRAELGRQA